MAFRASLRLRRRRVAASLRSESRRAEVFRAALRAPVCPLLQYGVVPAFVLFGPVVVPSVGVRRHRLFLSTCSEFGCLLIGFAARPDRFIVVF